MYVVVADRRPVSAADLVMMVMTRVPFCVLLWLSRGGCRRRGSGEGRCRCRSPGGIRCCTGDVGDLPPAGGHPQRDRIASALDLAATGGPVHPDPRGDQVPIP